MLSGAPNGGCAACAIQHAASLRSGRRPMHRRAAVSGARFLEAAVSLRYKDADSKIATSAAAPKCAGRSRYPLELSTDGIAVSRSPVPAAGSRTQTREDPAGGSRTSFRAVRSAISGGMLTRPTWSSACASRSYRSFYLLLPPPGCASGMAVPSTERVPVPSGATRQPLDGALSDPECFWEAVRCCRGTVQPAMGPSMQLRDTAAPCATNREQRTCAARQGISGRRLAAESPGVQRALRYGGNILVTEENAAVDGAGAHLRVRRDDELGQRRAVPERMPSNDAHQRRQHDAAE